MEDVIKKLIQISTLVDAGLARPEIVQPQQLALIGQLANSSYRVAVLAIRIYNLLPAVMLK